MSSVPTKEELENQPIVVVSLHSLRHPEYNPRQRNEEEMVQLKKSLSIFGQVDSLVINRQKERNGIIIGGNMRVDAMKELGWTHARTTSVNLNIEQEMQLNIRLNKNTGRWDYEVMYSHFQTDDLLNWGFQDWELYNEKGLDNFFGEDDNKTDDNKDEPVICPHCGKDIKAPVEN